MNPDIPASVVLRKAKILAASLRHSELDDWISSELNGYTDVSTMPAYRQTFPPLLGTFSGPFGSMVSDYAIPVSLLPDFMRDTLNELPMAHALRELEAMAASETSVLRHNLPTEACILARDVVKLSGGYTLIEMHQPITRAVIEGIIDAVRTRFLDFLLGLQDINSEVLTSEEALSALSKEQVAHTFNVTIQGDNNIVATQSTLSDISVQSIRANDVDSLTAYLSSVGLTQEDITELKTALEEDGQPEPPTLGRRVTGWIGAMVSKAVAGTWNVALAAAPELLKEAVLRHYGWKS